MSPSLPSLEVPAAGDAGGKSVGLGSTVAAAPTPPADRPNPHTDLSDIAVDWDDFWSQPPSEGGEWYIEPIIPGGGRSTAIFGTAGVGKSELAMWLVLAAVDAGSRVLYLDAEMGSDDLADRLAAFGVGPGDDLGGLFYVFDTGDLHCLNCVGGGDLLLQWVATYQIDLVILDTFTRFLTGDENAVEVMRGFHREVGKPLRDRRVSLVRIDHEGKDPTRGQRGTSGKADDVDLVWRLTQSSGGARLTAKKRRSRWMPETVDLQRSEDPVLAYRVASSEAPAEVIAIARALDDLEAPIDVTRRGAADMLRKAGMKLRNDLVSPAIRYRKRGPQSPGPRVQHASGTMPGTIGKKPHETRLGPLGDHRGPTPQVAGDHWVPLEGDQGYPTRPEPFEAAVTRLRAVGLVEPPWELYDTPPPEPEEMVG